MVALCHICGKIGRNRCSMCGRYACENDYDSKTGLCRSCLAGRRGH